MSFTRRFRFALILFALSGFSARAETDIQVGITTAKEILDSWKAGQITGICPYDRIPPSEIERLKQAVVASGFLSADYQRGNTVCTMMLCPNAKVPPYVFPSDAGFNQYYTASDHEGRPCFTHTEPGT